jgi:hypothetical protein
VNTKIKTKIRDICTNIQSKIINDCYDYELGFSERGLKCKNDLSKENVAEIKSQIETVLTLLDLIDE